MPSSPTGRWCHFGDAEALLSQGYVAPLSAVLPADTETPVSAFIKLARTERQAFLFESVEPGERIGRFSFIGLRPRNTIRTQASLGRGPFAELAAFQQQTLGLRLTKLPPFTGGLVGFLGAEAICRLEPKVPTRVGDDLGFGESTLFDIDTLVAFDNVRREIHLIAQARPEDGRIAIRDAKLRLTDLRTRLAKPVSLPRPAARPAPQFQPLMSKATFLKQVRKAKEFIAAGDIQQVVLSQRFEAQSTVPGLELYRALRRINPSPFMFYVKDGARELIGASPERLVEVRGERVSVRPIAGTRKRGTTPEADETLASELLADPKEAAEHVMLVDLGRNDVGKVSAFGSVRVESSRVVERYSHVLHLVSQVSGTLASDKTSIDALCAAFPAGTLSGAPKVRALQIIDALEPVGRALYGGAVGYLDVSGDLDFAITIRSFMKNGTRLAVQAGAGIVHDSVPLSEYQETLNKAGALFAAATLAARGHRP
jgi:anthranilate synthase component I